MRLNDKEVRTHVIESMEACVPNKQHLPWGKDRLEIHRYLVTVAEINTLDHFETNYQGYPLTEWKIYKPIAEKCMIPSRVVAIASDYAANLINTKKYELQSDDQYVVEKTVRVRSEEDPSKLVPKIERTYHRYEAMTLPEFNRMTLAIIQALRGNLTVDQVLASTYHVEKLQSAVAEREIVNGKVITMETIGLHLNTTSFTELSYAYDANVTEQLAFNTYIAKYVKGEK